MRMYKNKVIQTRSEVAALTTAAAKKNSSNSEEAEAIAKAGNVRTVPFVEQRSVLL